MVCLALVAVLGKICLPIFQVKVGFKVQGVGFGA